MKIYNTITKKKEFFTPIDRNNIKIYVCGPTVYDMAHIGNARSVVVYDILFRLLQVMYNKVTYVRNITDVDDKIIDAAKTNNCSIDKISSQYTKMFHEDMKQLNCLDPTNEPKATENIDIIISIIEKLLIQKHAYVENNTVYFDINSYPLYGQLSNRSISELIHGSRVEIELGKKHPGDFVLWKPANTVDSKLKSCWQSPWGLGRPGWHIECSAMSYSYLGESFDIHGGGSDLQFPHHENELAQSKCAFPHGQHAKYWIHNGFLTVNGDKMSKSLGNFTTVRELLNQEIKGEVIRYVLLNTHYKKPLDWNVKILSDAKESLNRFYTALNTIDFDLTNLDDIKVSGEVINSLKDDLNTPKALTKLHEITTQVNKAQDKENKLNLLKKLVKSANFLGFLYHSPQDWFSTDESEEIQKLINQRIHAKQQKDFKTADNIRKQLLDKNIILSDNKDGSTRWFKK